MNLKLEYIGQVEDFHMFKYRVDGKEQITRVKQINDGKLADVAPTVLSLMGIEKPQSMTGVSLLN